MLAAVWPPTATVAAGAGHKSMSPMQAIRRKCLDCSGGQSVEVKLCEAVACPLWPFRAGRHPYTKSRVQEAISEEGTSGGTQIAETPSSSPIGLQEASSWDSGAMAPQPSGEQ
jgi:hypothetical protein